MITFGLDDPKVSGYKSLQHANVLDFCQIKAKAQALVIIKVKIGGPMTIVSMLEQSRQLEQERLQTSSARHGDGTVHVERGEMCAGVGVKYPSAGRQQATHGVICIRPNPFR